MTCNVARMECILRATIGVGLISLVFVGPLSPWGWLGAILVATALFRWCPIYAVLGVSTCGTNSAKTGAGP